MWLYCCVLHGACTDLLYFLDEERDLEADKRGTFLPFVFVLCGHIFAFLCEHVFMGNVAYRIVSHSTMWENIFEENEMICPPG